MRALFGWTLLLLLCGLAGYLQNRWSKSVRAEREELRSMPSSVEGREASWGSMRVGRPSGAEAMELPKPPSQREERGDEEAEEPGHGPVADAPFPEPEDLRPADFEYVVPSGRVLSKICEDFYQSGRPPIPERVATYNGLKSPDDLRAGFLLKLPPWEVLFPDGEERP